MDGRLDDFLTLLLVERLERVAPLLMTGLIDQGRDGRQRLLTVGNHRHVGLHVLVDLAVVDIEVDNLRLLGVGLQVSCHTVGEAHADGDEHVALLLLQVHGIVAVHTQHTDIQRMIGG